MPCQLPTTRSGSSAMWAALFSLAALAACEGQIGAPEGGLNGVPNHPPGSGGGTGVGGGTTGGGPGTCAASPGRSPLRRLNRDEYRNTLHDLIPAAAKVIDTTVDTFPLDEEKLGFTNNADALTVSGTPGRATYMTAAETFATEATTAANLTNALLPCDPAKTGETRAPSRSSPTSDSARFGARSRTDESSPLHRPSTPEGNKDGFAHGIELVDRGVSRVAGLPLSPRGGRRRPPTPRRAQLSPLRDGDAPLVLPVGLDARRNAARRRRGWHSSATADRSRSPGATHAGRSQSAGTAVATFHREWLSIGRHRRAQTRTRPSFPDSTTPS